MEIKIKYVLEVPDIALKVLCADLVTRNTSSPVDVVKTTKELYDFFKNDTPDDLEKGQVDLVFKAPDTSSKKVQDPMDIVFNGFK